MNKNAEGPLWRAKDSFERLGEKDEVEDAEVNIDSDEAWISFRLENDPETVERQLVAYDVNIGVHVGYAISFEPEGEDPRGEHKTIKENLRGLEEDFDPAIDEVYQKATGYTGSLDSLPVLDGTPEEYEASAD